MKTFLSYILSVEAHEFLTFKFYATMHSYFERRLREELSSNEIDEFSVKLSICQRNLESTFEEYCKSNPNHREFPEELEEFKKNFGC